MAKKNKNKERNSETSKPLDRSDPNLHFGCGEFTLPNGDVYVGDYCAHRNGVIWREGHGIYTTHDGQIYEGLWSDDRLVENKEVLITYPNGAQYQGRLYKNKYHGPGTYVLESKMNLSCEFVENKPVGIITLVDCQGKLWKGKAGANSTILLPENVFYLGLNDYKGKGVSKEPLDYERPSASSSSIKEEDKLEELSDREWEKIIFAKTKLTEDEIDFTDSKWAKDYDEFRRKYDGIKTKIDEGTSLEEEDYVWIEKFKKFKHQRELKKENQNLKRIKERGEVFRLNERFRSKDFIESCPGVKVLYPQKHAHLRHGKMATESDDDIGVNDKANIIYADSAGEMIPPPPSEEELASHSSAQSSSSTQPDEIEEFSPGDDMTVKFNELVEYSNEQFKRLSNFAPQPLQPSAPCKSHSEEKDIGDTYLWDNTLHFSAFRDGLLIDRKIEVAMEKQYQEEKERKAQEAEDPSKSRSTEGKAVEKPSSAELPKKKDKKETRSQISVECADTDRKSSVQVVKTASEMKQSKLEGNIRRCVEQFLVDRKEKLSRAARYYVEDRHEKLHKHSIAAHTESLTGIPRELLLRK